MCYGFRLSPLDQVRGAAGMTCLIAGLILAGDLDLIEKGELGTLSKYPGSLEPDIYLEITISYAMKLYWHWNCFIKLIAIPINRSYISCYGSIRKTRKITYY